MLSRFFKSKKLINTWFLSYLLIFLISIVLSIAIVIFANNLTNITISRSTNYLLNKTKDRIDTTITSSINLIEQIYVNDDILSLLNTNKNDSSKMSMDYYNSYQALVDFQTFQKHLDECIIYFNRYDKIISSTSGAMSSDLFYRLRFDSTQMDMVDYYHLISGRFRYEMSLKTIGGKDKILFRQSLPSPSARNIQANVIIIYDESLIKHIASAEDALKDGLIAIKKENEIIYTTNNDLFTNVYDLALNSFVDAEYEFMEIDGKDYIISETKAALAGYSYLIVLPKSEFYTDYNILRIIIISAISISLIISLLVSLMFARYQYRPIENILQTIGPKNLLSSNTANEYSIINSSIVESIIKLEQMETTLEHYRPIIKSTFLKRLIRGEAEISEKLHADMLKNGVIFDKKKFYVICIYIEEFEQSLIPPIYEYDYTKPTAISNVILTNSFDELDMIEQLRYSVTIDETIIYIVNHDIPDDEAYQYVQDLIDQVQNTVNDKYAIDFSTGISSFNHAGIETIHEAWQEAVYALDYKTILGKHSIIFYDDIQNTKRYYNDFPQITREKLINYINIGDKTKALDLLNHVIDINYKEHMAMETVVCLTNDIVSTIVSVFSNEEGSEFLDNVKPNRSIYHARRDGKYIPDVLRDILVQACECKNNLTNNSQHQNLSISVKEYIDNNYNNMNLNISLLGEVFSLTPTYLSKIFKEYTNQYLLDYINHARITNSKKLLSTTNESLANIADSCGYNNANSFIRVFKKMEGITPGNYRKINSKKKSKKKN